VHYGLQMIGFYFADDIIRFRSSVVVMIGW